MKSKIYIYILIAFLVVVLVLSAIELTPKPVPNGDLVYPGNGFTYFSKDTPVESLNKEMQNFFSTFSFFEKKDDKIYFNDIPSTVTYESALTISGPTTYLLLDIVISSGTAFLTIGDLKYTMTPTESIIEQNGKKVFPATETDQFLYEENQLVSTSMGIRKIGSEKAVALFGSSGEHVELDFPASISLELSEGSSGEIGQWIWVRGLE